MPAQLAVLLWVVGLSASLTIAFGIGAPFIWSGVFGYDPPDSVSQVSSMLEVLAAVVALGVAVAAGTVYALVDRHLETRARDLEKTLHATLAERLENRVKEREQTLEQDLAAKLATTQQDLNKRLTTAAQEALATLDTRLNEQMQGARKQLLGQVAKNAVHLSTSASFALWALYDQLRRQSGPEAGSLRVSELLESAIALCQRSYDRHNGSLDPGNDREDEYAVCELFNNWGYLLAERGNVPDRSWALRCAAYLNERKENNPANTANWQDTIDFIQQRYP